MANGTETNSRLILGLAFLAGIGFVAMMTAIGIGVIQGLSADEEALGILFLIGTGAFVCGLFFWMVYVRPWERFDDINEPQYHSHHDKH